MPHLPDASSRSAKIGTVTALALIIANMIGTGAFTSLGFQLKETGRPAVVLALWIVGGVVALSGAFSYAEVGTAIKKSGGEYTFLSHIYHPLAGYLSGWISLTVGFAAPIALSAMAAVAYFPLSTGSGKWIAVGLIFLVTLIHTRGVRSGARFQRIATLLKVTVMVTLIAVGLALPSEQSPATVFPRPWFSGVDPVAFAVLLIYVSYSYSGWNAVTYITDEVRRPSRTLPVSLVGGALIVTVLYTLLQYVFLKHVPVGELSGVLDVGNVAVQRMLGDGAGRWFGVAISLLLVSGISAMVWVGPRVTSGMGADYPMWRYFRSQPGEVPVHALWLQFFIASALLLTGTFEQIMIYCGVLLSVSTMMTVFGTFILRRKPALGDGKQYKSPLFPLFPLIFLFFSVWMIVFVVIRNPLETLIGLVNLMVGAATWFWGKKR
ncbi:MAG TPA: amino acid permease [Porphyromonadaceae bacterium]|jgi:APA family basic amino acid/polyamine antiporter|nr:amino acid permease [Porphyromonadaceae bacterium]HBL33420.1 amino acid permease [Porphyromonadaceae bacterium]HBX20824.1 amino acid permease [Porphyromonadaceae bacterium]HCM20122.1 amino acid permease [Porphyromonadaceae bacterium]